VGGRRWQHCFQKRLPDHSSIFTAELDALLLALRMVYQSRDTKFLIVSDSLSALQAFASRKLTHPVLADLHDLHSSMAREGKDIVFMWAPSHVGIRGNCAADARAKEALGHEPSKFRPYVPYADFKCLVRQYTFKLWQEQWSEQKNNKLYQIMPDLSLGVPIAASGRKAETVLNRLLLGHTYFTHSHLLRGDDQPWCSACDVPLSVRHVFTECADLFEARVEHLGCDPLNPFSMSMKDIFNLSVEKIFNFLKTINLFYKT
jgi:hypothetical protein